MGISLQSFGAAGEVTGSKHLLTLPDGTRLLLDCGEFQGRRADADAKNREFPFPPGKNYGRPAQSRAPRPLRFPAHAGQAGV